MKNKDSKTTMLTMFDRDIFNKFVEPGEIVEVRIPNVQGKSEAWGGCIAEGSVSGYFDDHNRFCEAVSAADQTNHSGIYFSLQEIDSRLIGRAFNRLIPTTLTTKNSNVVSYKWLPIDINPVRPFGISSSYKELNSAIQVRDEIANHYKIEGTKVSRPIRAISGNGGHLLYRIPTFTVTGYAQETIKNILTNISTRFSSETIHINTSVFHPATIWRLYGTTAKRGDYVPVGEHRDARPHRIAYIDDIGDDNG